MMPTVGVGNNQSFKLFLCLNRGKYSQHDNENKKETCFHDIMT
jgi:hypothetical protein